MAMTKRFRFGVSRAGRGLNYMRVRNWALFLLSLFPILPLTACGNEAKSGAAATTDTYANLSARQVMETYAKAYQSEDWGTCKKLLASSVSFKSADEFELRANSVRKEQGPIENLSIISEADQGATFIYRVAIKYQNRSQPYTFADAFEIQRINNTWKITNFPYV